ncbi:phosphoglycolate phosphatase [Acidihalobacter aeolianus]|uniref:Phosphoglycolate phosphatase n=1 Tax=Acidihalobacter aeolianus TaxID=2792603 RepID=A0A1D8K8D4_9GAMM|nr:HAD-IA family hydrolase [Acidihalobacter aeolianus]AOV17208.1 phosphoglycolate phosphatase [Acidihalobacter aeolianus]
MPSQINPTHIRGVLFDLDGTLADTALDMAAALNRLRVENALPPLPFTAVRDHVSHGSTAMIRIGFGDNLPKARFEALRRRFLDIYSAALAAETVLFPGMGNVLETLESRGIAWGIVTNKPGFLTRPLIAALGLTERSACLVSGDDLPQRKPHPATLLHAAQLCDLPPSTCCYLGDAERDITAGKSAGMHTLIASWGYIDAEQRPDTWGADDTLTRPDDLLAWIDANSLPVATPSLA